MIRLIEFTWIWMHMLHLQLPKHHRAICRFLEKISEQEKRGLLMAFRASGKSTLVGLFCVWLLLENPNLRILIVAADHMLAKKMVQHIKRIIDIAFSFFTGHNFQKINYPFIVISNYIFIIFNT